MPWVFGLIAVFALSYFTVGMGVHWLARDVLGLSVQLADRAAMWAFLGTPPLLAILVLIIAMRTSPRRADVTFGSARFMSAAGTAQLAAAPGLIVGRDRATGTLLHYSGEAHLLTIAPTRSGKGIGTIIPNLLTYDGPLLCIDPKGENARVTAGQRRMRGPVHVLDPFGVSGEAASAYNPLDSIGADGGDVAEDAAAIAEALVADPPGQIADAHWNEEAKALIAGVLLHIAHEEVGERRTLGHLRELLTLAPAAFQTLLGDMADSPAARGLVARSANRQLGKSGREAAGVLSSAQRHTHFLDSERIQRVTARSEFRLEDLGTGASSLFLVLPPDRLALYNRWLRLMIVQVLGSLTRRQVAAKPPLLFLLDEFASLGRLEPVARAMGLMAGYGIQLWPILQDIHQLRSVYGQDAGTFLSNAGCVQLFNVGDIETAEWVSRSLGDTTVDHYTGSDLDETGGAMFEGRPDWSGRTPANDQIARRPLLTADEVRRLPADELLLLIAGAPPVRAVKLRYFADREFKGMFRTGE